MSLPFCWSGHVFSPPRSNVSKVTSIICSISKCHLRTLLILSGNCCGKKEGLCRNCWGTCLEGVVPHTFPSSLSPFVSLPHPENLSKICKEVLKTNQRFFLSSGLEGHFLGVIGLCFWTLPEPQNQVFHELPPMQDVCNTMWYHTILLNAYQSCNILHSSVRFYNTIQYRAVWQCVSYGHHFFSFRTCPSLSLNIYISQI